MEKDIDNFEEAIVYHELADSITNAMEELNSRELIASLQKKYENEKLRNDNLQMKVRYTNFILWGTKMCIRDSSYSVHHLSDHMVLRYHRSGEW